MGDNFHRLIRLLQLVPRAPRFIDTELLVTILGNEGIPAARRTIQRDMMKLEGMGFGLECLDDSKPFRWRFQEGAAAMLMPGADPQAALAMRLVELHLERLMPKSSLRALRPHIEASKKALEGKPVAKWLEKVRLIPRNQPLVPPKMDGDVVGVIHEALLEGKQIAGRYRRSGADEPKEMTFHPLGLVYRDSVAYLVATAWDYTDVRIYPFHRFTSAKLLDVPSKSVSGFNLDAFVEGGELAYRIGDADIHLSLLFEPNAGRALEESPLSDKQKVTRRDDKKLLVEAHVPDTHVLRAWLLGFGAGVEVLKPAPLRKAIGEALATASERYR